MTYIHFNQVVDNDRLCFSSAMQRYIFLEACFRSDRRGVVRMPQSELAQVSLLSPRTVASQFAKLEDTGFLVRLGHGRYQIVVPDSAKTSDPIEKTINPLLNQLKQWCKQRFPDREFVTGKKVAIMSNEEDTIPEYVSQAIDEGLLVIEQELSDGMIYKLKLD